MSGQTTEERATPTSAASVLSDGLATVPPEPTFHGEEHGNEKCSD